VAPSHFANIDAVFHLLADLNVDAVYSPDIKMGHVNFPGLCATLLLHDAPQWELEEFARDVHERLGWKAGSGVNVRYQYCDIMTISRFIASVITRIPPKVIFAIIDDSNATFSRSELESFLLADPTAVLGQA